MHAAGLVHEYVPVRNCIYFAIVQGTDHQRSFCGHGFYTRQSIQKSFPSTAVMLNGHGAFRYASKCISFDDESNAVLMFVSDKLK